MSTDSRKKLRLVIIGGGTGGLAFLRLFHKAKEIEVLGIADIRPEAPAIKYAQSIGVPTTTDFRQLIKGSEIDLIVDVTGNPDVRAQITNEKEPQVELFGGTTAKLMWHFIEMLEQKVEERTRDLTDAQAKLLQSEKLIQSEKLAGIGVMAAGIAHEINNPIFGIMGMAEAILVEGNSNLVKEYAKDIIKYSKTVSSIVKGLTIYSRSTAAGDTGLMDVNEKLDDAIKIVRHSVEFDDIEIIKNYKADKKVMINSGELQQVFVNIIHNAAQAMNGKGRLLLSTRADDDDVTVRISDNGPGIPKEHIGKIFDPFFTTKDPDQGTGLGLSIAYGIIQKYNGSIGVESEEGKGTTFTIKFSIREKPLNQGGV